MPYLGDYLGQLLSEITIARMHADLETVRVAELYASHPLLRTLPVPHFRLPDIDLEVPVVIKQMDEPGAGQSPRGGFDPKLLRKNFDAVLASRLRKDRIRMTAEQTKHLRLVLDDTLATMDQPAEIAVDTNRIADRFADAAAKVLGEKLASGKPDDRERLKKITAELRTAARLAFLKARIAPPRLTALVTTQEVREAGSAENVTRLRLKITEESVEWTQVESDGEMRDRLIPE